MIMVEATDADFDDTCYVCRSKDRYVSLPKKSFTMPNGESWNCKDLEETAAAEVSAQSNVCGSMKAWASSECGCEGAPVEPDRLFNPNPQCNICKDSRGVPNNKREELVNTGVAGEFPCGVLYDTAANGALPRSLCTPIQNNVADYCCNPDSFRYVPQPLPTQSPSASAYPTPTAPSATPSDAPSKVPTPSPSQFPSSEPTPEPEPTCLAVHAQCQNRGLDCCPGYVCKPRGLSQIAICSAPRVRVGRTSVARPGLGGAAARRRNGG